MTTINIARTSTSTNNHPAEHAQPDWLDKNLYPFTSHYVTIAGTRLHYIDEGAGQIILFLHGTASWSFLYRDIIKNLHPDFRCIALDFPGFGLSTASANFETSLVGNSHLVEQFIAQLGLQDIIVYGHDAAASMALGVMVRQPDNFRGMIVANAFGFPLEGRFPKITRFLKVVRTRFFRAMIVHLNFLQWYTARGLRGGKLTKAEKRAYLEPTRDKSRRLHHHAMLASILDSNDFLLNIEKCQPTIKDMPILLTFGNTDEAYKVGFMQQWEQLYPNHRSYIIECGTHFPQEDDPQGIANEIRNWWQEVG